MKNTLGISLSRGIQTTFGNTHMQSIVGFNIDLPLAIATKIHMDLSNEWSLNLKPFTAEKGGEGQLIEH